MFNVAATRFCLKEHALEIYVAGCKGLCKGCHNPELWDDKVGRPWIILKDEIEEIISDSGDLVKSIRIYGGELLEKPQESVLEFLKYLKTLNKELWLFTRFDFSLTEYVRGYLDYIKCGPYDETKLSPTTQYGVILASSNQKIYKKGVDWDVLSIH